MIPIDKISIDQIILALNKGDYALPEFQRGYEWKTDRVKRLFMSLYKGYPCGTFLLWKTIRRKSIMRGDLPEDGGEVTLILDGQQRMTAIYGVVCGIPPKQFYDGDAKEFSELWFNVATETIEVYNKQKMDTPRSHWISITKAMQWSLTRDVRAINALVSRYNGDTAEERRITENIYRLLEIVNYTFPVYEIGPDTKFKDVITIFDRVNTGGKALSEGDIAIAKLCGQWDDARRELKRICTYYDNVGTKRFEFDLGYMTRLVTIYVTGQPRYNKFFDAMCDDISLYAEALPECKRLIQATLDQISQRLGLDSNLPGNDVFASPASIMTIIYYNKVHARNMCAKDWDLLLYWYAQSFIWGRYASSFITRMAADIKAIHDGHGVEGLLDNLIRDNRGGNKDGLHIYPEDFIGRGQTNSTFYSLLYMLTRFYKSQDLAKGFEVKRGLLNPYDKLEVHHIFPQSTLRSRGYDKDMIDTIANYALITGDTNKLISNRAPKNYLQDFGDALATQWIPQDQSIWEYSSYEAFLAARRELLAKAANELLHSLNPSHPL